MWQWAFCAAVVWQVWAGSHWGYWLWWLLLLPFCAGGARRKYAFAILALILGAWWAAWHVQGALAMWLPKSHIGETLLVRGEVVPFSWQETETHYGAKRYSFTVNAQFITQDKHHQGVVRLAYYPSPEDALTPFRGGESVVLKARLKPPHSTVNEGLLSRVQLDFARGVIAQGTVQHIVSRDPAAQGLSWWREQISYRLRQQLASWPQAQALLPALVVADRRHVTESQWRRFRESGTAHLLAISGLHVSLVAGLVWWLGRLALLPWLPRGQVAAVYAAGPAMVAALAYAALAGFSLPTQRALIMCLALMWFFVRGRTASLFSGFRYAFLGVLLWAPLSVADPSFWLSFCAVFLLLVLITVGQKLSWWRAQLVLSFGVGALGAWWFGSWGVLAPLANWVLIPVFAWCVVPLALLMALGVPVAWLAPVVNLAITLCEQWLQLLEPWQLQLSGASGVWELMALLFAMVMIFMPRLPVASWVLLIPLLPWLWPQDTAPMHGEFDFVTLDVGQGLATVIRTRHHLLLYDTGPSWGYGDAGKSVLVPWLQRQPQQLTLGVISHSDTDHSGGSESIQQVWPDIHWLAGEPQYHHGAQACWRGQQWRWDGVDFEVLWPPAGLRLHEHNNYSCVIQVQGRFGAVLLTGDIHRPVEFWLAKHQRFLHNSVLQVPHHGSATSSSYSFLKTLMPRYAVVSHGFANAFRHPHWQVEQRYKALNIALLSTAESGMIVFPVRDHHNSTPIQWRYKYPRSWY